MQVHACTCNILSNFHSSIPWHKRWQRVHSRVLSMEKVSWLHVWRLQNGSCIHSQMVPRRLDGNRMQLCMVSLWVHPLACVTCFELCGDLTYLLYKLNHVLDLRYPHHAVKFYNFHNHHLLCLEVTTLPFSTNTSPFSF